MPQRTRLVDHARTAGLVLFALVVLVVGLSRGNWRVGVLGAAAVLLYAMVRGATQRLAAGEHERMVSTLTTTGRAAGAVAVGGLLAALLIPWEPGLWLALGAVAVVGAFGAAWVTSRR